MRFEEFEAEAHRMWAEIPAEFKEGIDGLVVSRDTYSHPDHDDYYTLGMCFTEPYPSEYGGPDTTRSFLALYHGSFREVAKDDPDFPWEEELWETITHELRHHLEHLADDDELGGVDYAMEETYRREKGLDFDPWYYQVGSPDGPGVYRVERDVYLERPWRDGEIREGDPIEFEWEGRRWSVPAPEGELEDVHYLWLDRLAPEGGAFQLVLVRRPRWWERVRRIFARSGVTFGESVGEARELGAAGGGGGDAAGGAAGGAGGASA